MNGIRRSDVWYALEGFYLALTSIRGELENLLLNVSKESEVASHEAELDDNPANAPEGTEYLSAAEPSESGGAGDDDETDQLH